MWKKNVNDEVKYDGRTKHIFVFGKDVKKVMNNKEHQELTNII